MAFTFQSGRLLPNCLMRVNSFQVANTSCRNLHWKWSSHTMDSSSSSRKYMQMLRHAFALSSGQTLRSRVALMCGFLAHRVSHSLKKFESAMCMYRSLYSEQTLQSLATGFAKRHLKGRRKNYVLFGGACFAWDREKVSDQHLDSCLDDVELIRILSSDGNSNCEQLTSWEKVMSKSQMMVWRRKLKNMYLYEYKVFGTFNDCTAKSFYKVQLDLDYRKVWDKHVIDTEVIDRDSETGTEVVYWSTHFPYPMHSRDYVFRRRSKIFHRHRIMAIVSEATSHPRRPESKRHVRVSKYASKMVIKPFSSFDEIGFDYILTYHDDPKAPIPSTAVSWMTHTGVPGFVQKLHDAAVALDTSSGKNFKDLQSEEQYTSPASSCYS